MLKSVNHSWGITPKFRQKYGDIWADLDFYFEDKVSSDRFRTDPMNCNVGTLHVANQNFKFTYKDLISHTSSVSNTIKKSYVTEPEGVIPFYIKSKTILLTRTEANRLSATLEDSLTSVRRAYELGLYL
jgi:hypothetical protein